MSEETWENAYDAQLERSQEDWMAEKRGEVRCTICDGSGLARDNDPCLSCRGTGFVAGRVSPKKERDAPD